MKRALYSDVADTSSTVTIGVTDLMTSLAVIFILLFTAYVSRSYESPKQVLGTVEEIQTVLREQFKRFDLVLEADPGDPRVFRIIVPEELLNFEFGNSHLSAAAQQFLSETMPLYAEALCGPLGDKIDSLVIQGHTDDRGSDLLNWRLSQERALNVMAKGLEVIQAVHPWAYECFQEKASASGRGRQDLIYEDPGVPNRDKSRRVIFKLRVHPDIALPHL